MSAKVLRVPGDKSIAHRALLFASLASGVTEISGLPDGEDVGSSASCVEALGARVEREGDRARVTGLGLRWPRRDEVVELDCGNSGTTMRLLCGLLAGQPQTTRLTGDASLSRRPMGRVIDPLAEMGADLRSHGSAPGLAPIEVRGTALRGHRFELAIASAQVKSALLLAGLLADGPTEVIEPGDSRDHSERMLRAMGAELVSEGRRHRLTPPAELRAQSIAVPGDISSAAFWLGYGLLADTPLAIHDVGLNPTRTGVLDALRAAGAPLETTIERKEGGEPVGRIELGSGQPLRPLAIEGAIVPRLVDELPMLMLMAACIPGRSTFRGCRELRVKESDRIRAVANALTALGVPHTEHEDGLEVEGGGPLASRAAVASEGDHRLALGLCALGAARDVALELTGAEAAAVSYPSFADELAALSGWRAS